MKAIIGLSQNIENIKRSIDQIAKTEENVLVIGEKGVGKDLVAQNLYHRSKRVGKPFVKINCALVSGTSMEIEIFGYEPTTPSDFQIKNRELFERINNGVLFLDKIDEIPSDLQTKFYKLLQNWGCIPSLDPEKSPKTDIWTIAATSRNLEEDIITGKFRQDLFCFLSTRKILIEPLRRRPEDIPCLIHHYMQQYAKCANVETIKGLPKKSIRRMVKYHWPGNVRELESVVKRILIFGNFEPVCQYRIPGLNDDPTPPTDDLAFIDMPQRLSKMKFEMDLATI